MIPFLTDKNLSSWKWRSRWVFPWYFNNKEHRMMFMPVDIINGIQSQLFDQLDELKDVQ